VFLDTSSWEANSRQEGNRLFGDRVWELIAELIISQI
jgi:hypothetical protein